jgi:hypothetical protein
MNWFERVSEDIEEIISEECGLLEELISSGAMQIVTRPYQKNPEIIIHYFDDEENPPLVISYNIQENYFYREIEPPDENMPAIRFMFKDIDKLVEYILHIDLWKMKKKMTITIVMKWNTLLTKMTLWNIWKILR